MSIVRWDPFRELDEMNDRLNRFFGRSALSRSDRDALTVVDWAPSVDIVETPEEFQIKAELPDVKKDDVSVSVDGNVLRRTSGSIASSAATARSCARSRCRRTSTTARCRLSSRTAC
jgi:HSP20 family molecular chaperone IbpA